MVNGKGLLGQAPHLDTFVGNTSCGGVNDYDYAVPIPLMDAIRVARQLTDFTTTSETLERLNNELPGMGGCGMYSLHARWRDATVKYNLHVTYAHPDVCYSS